MITQLLQEVLVGILNELSNVVSDQLVLVFVAGEVESGIYETKNNIAVTPAERLNLLTMVLSQLFEVL